MAFSPEQIAALSAKLDGAHVKKREQAGRKFSYVEAWHCIAEANRIFGFDGWTRETVDMTQLGEPREVDGKWRVAYRARVRIVVHGRNEKGEALGLGYPGGTGVVRDGCGYGSGIDRDLGAAHESALKEAESDAMKRALMTFGNPFGLALYDKAQENVEHNGHAGHKPAETPANAAPLPDEIVPNGSWLDWENAYRRRLSACKTKTEQERIESLNISHRLAFAKEAVRRGKPDMVERLRLHENECFQRYPHPMEAA